MTHAHAPYSNYHVGAAVLADDGSIYAGCNVENASFPEGWCAETSAIGAMVSAWVNAILLGSILYRRGYLVLDARSKRTLPRLLLACVALGGATWGAVYFIWPGSQAGTEVQALSLVAIIAVGAAAFAALALLFRVVSIAELRNLRRKR